MDPSLLARLGRRTYRARWGIVVFWLVLLLIGAFFAPRVTGILRGGGYTIGKSQSASAYSTLNRAFGYQALTYTAVFTATPAEQPHLIAEVQKFRSAARRRFGHVLTFGAPHWTPDHRVVFVRVDSAPQQDFGARFAEPLTKLMPGGQTHGYLAGPAAIFHDMESVSDQDLRSIEIVTLPIALIVLLLIFGSITASIVPILMAPVSVTLALALVYFLGQRIDMSIFVLNTTSMLGLGVAIDYSLFMVNRFREELAMGRDCETAVANTVATSGRAILVSALVVSVGFSGLSLSGISMLTSLGIGGSIVTAISLIVALTLLPAILGILGHRINSLRVVPQRLTVGHLWHRLARRVMKMPLPIIGVVIVIIGVLSIPAFHLRVGIPGPEILPSSVGSRAGNDILGAHLGIANQSPVLVVVSRNTGTPASTFQTAAFAVLDRVCSSRDVAGVSPLAVANSPNRIQSCQQALRNLQHPSRAQSAQAVAQSRKQRVALLSVYLHSNPSSSASESYVSSLRSASPVSGYRILVGGQTAGQMDFDHYLYSRFPLVIVFVTLVIFALLLIAFRSLLLPLKAVLMNVFSVLAAYGATVWAFQDGHLARALGFTQVGNIDSIVPVFLFCVLFGISTDYEVFLLTRVQEHYLQTGDNEESVAVGLEVTGRIITSAALIMIVVFGAFAFARLVVIKEIGLGLAVAVLIDATLIRALLVPATMRLLGRWNWWMPFRGFRRVKRQAGAIPAGHSASGE